MIIEHPPPEGVDDPSVETILIFSANADDQQSLDLDREVEQIANGLRRAGNRKRFRIVAVAETTAEQLRQALLDYRPAYVHFCGHGTGIGGIALEGHLVSAGALANLFALFASTIKCVVLNACYSEMQAQAIVRHIDYVVGMNKAIGDMAAIEFATAFYDALGAGEDVPTAVLFGRSAIQLARLPEHLTPELLIRDPNGPPRRMLQKDRDWDGAPAVSLLYGREAVAEMLRGWILDDFCRIVLITGMGGIGKSDLASCLGRGANRTANTSRTLASGIEGHFDAVLWRSLLNAPLPEELFADILGVMIDHGGPLPFSPVERMNDVLRCLKQRRCLLILDNIEAVLRPGDPEMRYRDGFELYGTFLADVAKTNHLSCLLLTSREKPYPITTLAGANKPVRSLRLEGIDSGAIQNVFAQISAFSGSDRNWEEIGKIYGGNPLSIELVARHIDEVYDGNVDAFLASGQPLFGDVEALLDWHFDRLSDGQLEIVDWLAIEREPVTLASLRESLLSRKSKEGVTSTLQALQRRLPLEERGNQQYTLQPVLIEHATARIVKRVVDTLRHAIADAVGLLADGGASRTLFTAMRTLNSHALMKASSRDNIREMQERLILGPIAEDIGSEWRRADLKLAFESMLHIWRTEIGSKSGYAAGNVVNLLVKLGVALDCLDVSKVAVWEACLDDVDLHAADFSFAHFRKTTFRHAFGTVFYVCYSPDGSLIAAGDDNGHVQFFNASSGELHQSCAGHADAVSAIAFSADGRVMASGSYDNTISLWNVADGHRTNTLLGHDGWVYSVALSSDGRSLASASEDGTCRLWDVQTGSWRRLPTPGATFLATVAFSPDGQFLAAGGGGGIVYLFRMDDLDHPLHLSHHTAGVRSIAFSRKGDLLATGGEGGEVALWQRSDGTLLAPLRGHTDNVTSISFSAGDDLLASASVDHTIRLWSTARMEFVAQLPGTSRVWSVACSPVTRTLVAASEDGTIRTWDMDTRQRVATLHGYSNKTWGLAFCETRSRLVAGNEDGVVRVWDPRDARITRELRGHATRIWAVACSADGRWTASASDDATVRLWDLESGTARHVWRGHTGWIRAVTFDSGSRRVASAAEDGNVIIWDIDSGARISTTDSQIIRLFAIAFCHRSELVAVAGSDSVIRVFSAVDGSHVGDLRGHNGWVNSLSATDGDTLLSCSADGTAKLWDLASWECSATLTTGQKVWTGAVLSGGKTAFVGLDDGVLVRWDIDGGRRETEVRAHQGAIWAMAVDRRAETVATAGDDGVIRLWAMSDLGPAAAPNALRSPRPYEAMNISGAEGLSEEQKTALAALGAIDMPAH